MLNKINKEFKNLKGMGDLKKLYYKLSLEHHPDKGGDLETMQQINKLYEQYFKYFKENPADKETINVDEVASDYINIVEELLQMGGIVIDIVGTWIWVDGNTKPYKDDLKELGFYWSNRHKKWYKSNSKRKRWSSKKSYKQITAQYGLRRFETEELRQLQQ